MNNIIFLDIDGVLNSQNTFINTKDIKINYHKSSLYNDLKYKLFYKLLDIDQNKIYLLKEIIRETNSKVVVTSSWRNLRIYPLIEEYLINIGIPIIGTTKYIDSRRKTEITDYLKNHQVDNYIIIDDDIFSDFDLELLSHLIHTNFYHDGLDNEHVNESIYKLKRF